MKYKKINKKSNANNSTTNKIDETLYLPSFWGPNFVHRIGTLMVSYFLQTYTNLIDSLNKAEREK